MHLCVMDLCFMLKVCLICNHLYMVKRQTLSHLEQKEQRGYFNLAPSQFGPCTYILPSQSLFFFLLQLFPHITVFQNQNKLIPACFTQTMNNRSDKKGRSAAIVVQALSTVLLGLTSFCNYVFPATSPDHVQPKTAEFKLLKYKMHSILHYNHKQVHLNGRDFVS